jgi:TRAP-type transport system periplasmic protein
MMKYPSRLGNALLTSGLIGLSLTGAAAPSSAQVQWQLATEYPASNISGVGLATFSTLVASKTNGFVTVATAFDNAAKIASGELPEAARQSRITGGDAFAGPLEATDAIFGLPSLPFVVQSVEAASTVNGRARGLYEKALAAKSLKLLYITIWPATGLWSDRPVTGADDLRGLAIRTYDQTSADVMRAVGAAADYLPFDEAIARLERHGLNAILSSGDGGAGQQLWHALHYFTAINYANPISVAFVRADAFAALPKEVQSQVEAAAAETERRQLATLSDRMVENDRRVRANGVTVVDPAPAGLMAALKAAAAAPIAAWKAKAGAEAAAIAEQAMRP